MIAIALCAFPAIAAACEGAGEEAPTWQVCTNLEAKIGSYSNGKCTEETTEGEYDWLEVTEATKVVEKGALTFKATLPSHTFEAKCSTTGEGTIRSEHKGEITKDTLEKCTGAAECETLESIKTINLPWETELFSENEETIREKIKNGHTVPSEEPGWDMTCKHASEQWTIECTSATTSTLIENLSGLVDSVFDTKSTKPTCRAGVKEGEGTVTGTTEIEVSGGKGLHASAGVVYRIDGKDVDFEGVKEKTTKPETIILRNSQTVTYTSVKPEGTNPKGNTAFTKGEDKCSTGKPIMGTPNNPGQCEIKVKFTPPGAKPYEAALRVQYSFAGVAAYYILRLVGQGEA
jgi:hypothetical protein